jgi:hypothetical protein
VARGRTEPGVELFFQLLDLEGHGRLGHEQALSAARVKDPCLATAWKNLEAAIGHRS